jgi:hypothetical protein
MCSLLDAVERLNLVLFADGEDTRALLDKAGDLLVKRGDRTRELEAAGEMRLQARALSVCAARSKSKI